MACTFKTIVANVDCKSVGGVSFCYVIPAGDITDFTFDATSGALTAVTLGGSGVVTKFNTFDTDDSAFYNQDSIGEDDTEKYSQEGYLKFTKITAAKVEAARDAGACCEGSVWFYFLADGSVLVQGLDYFKDLTRWSLTKKKAIVKPGVKSNTGADKSYVEYKINSEAQTLIPVDATVITEAYMDAL